MQPYGPQPHLGNFGEQAVQEQLLPYSTVCSGDVLLNIDRGNSWCTAETAGALLLPLSEWRMAEIKQCYGGSMRTGCTSAVKMENALEQTF